MRSRLPILAGLVIAVVLALWFGLFGELAGLLIGPWQDAGPPTTLAHGPRPQLCCRRVDRCTTTDLAAARAAFAYETLSAKIRLRVRLFQQNLVGKGEYFQLGPTENKLLRLDLKIRTAKTETRLQQVCDGRNLWVVQDLPASDGSLDRETTITRVDLRRVHDAVGRFGGRLAELPAADRLIRGGLANLLWELGGEFRVPPGRRCSAE